MNFLIFLFVVLIFVWAVLSAKTTRPDGTLLPVHPFRRMMTYIMPGRNESVVYFDALVNAEDLLEYMEKARGRFPVDVTHCSVAAVALGLSTAPKMNRFVAGHRLYERNERFISFSMKRKKMDKEAKLSAVKMDMPDGQTFEELCERINAKVVIERSDKKTNFDKEMALLESIPRPGLRFATWLLRTLDYFNILPGAFIRSDAMYTSVFVANLGSVKMDPGYHHLYEWGTCPLFIMIGKIRDRVIVEDGEPVVRKVMHIRFSYDERIDDGLNARFGIDAVVHALEHPYEYFGCLSEDGADARPLSEPIPGIG